MSQNAYLLEGHTGSHDDYGSWLVAVYLDKEEANQHLDDLKPLIHREAWPRMGGRQSQLHMETIRKSGLDAVASVDGYVEYRLSEIVVSEQAPRRRPEDEIAPLGPRHRESSIAERT